MRAIPFTLLSCLSGMLLGVPGSHAATTHNVAIAFGAFNPPNSQIKAGDSVKWTQNESFHTTTSGEEGVPNGLWDSGNMNPGDTFTFTFPDVGNYPYFCSFHYFTMTGAVNVESANNVAPSVAITNPTNGRVYTSPATNVLIQASASDSDGTIAQVEFFDGANSLGVDTVSPYSITITLGLGSHSLTAVARDNAGATATSSPVSVSVTTLQITNPIPERIPKGNLTIELKTVADGLQSPLGIEFPRDGTGRMFVFDQNGLIWVIGSNGQKLATPLLDLRTRLVRLDAYDERGLLGMALHPNFAANGILYTYTSEPNSGPADFQTTLTPPTTNNHQSVIAEWRISLGNVNQVDPATRREVMRIDQPQFNHNGGPLHFGPDGFLYIALGDGGNADDEGAGHSVGGNGQDTNNVWGSILRIDVDGFNSVNGQYGVPEDNPFVGVGGVDEIFAYGFRNPFAFSFDQANGTLYAGDVGQNKIEEIDIVTRGGNYGWNIKEGTFYFDGNGAGGGYVTDTPVRPVPPNLIDPIAQYDHDDGLAIVGGYVYRGTEIPTLAGRYVFGDWGNFNVPSGRLFYLDAGNVIREFRIGLDDRLLKEWIKGFAQDTNGEIYVLCSRVLGPAGNTGKILKLVAPPEGIEIKSIAKNGVAADVVWCGGSGPYALQRKDVLNSGAWANHTVTASTNASLVTDNQAFFRVSDAAHQPGIPLTAFMSGLSERPTPVTNSAAGSGTFSVRNETLRFEIRYTGLSGAAVAAHIHGAGTSEDSVGVLIDLAPYHVGPFGTSGFFTGVLLLTPAQKAAILSGLTYVNVHTGANPGGELRGQIAPVMMQAVMSGLAERPTPVTNSASGSGTFALVGNRLNYNITYSGLSGTATAAHIHGPAPANGATGVLISLPPAGAFGSSGSFTGAVTLTVQQLGYVVDGLTYVNVHTGANPGGELRGQIYAQATAAPLTALFSGLNERPVAVTNSARGTAIFSLEGDDLLFNIHYSSLSGNAVGAHIHGPATTDESAGVLIDLAPYNNGSFASSGALTGRLKLTPQQRNWMHEGLTYVNVHTSANPGGELRGQIAPVLMHASLSAVNERPSIRAFGSGAGIFTLVWDRLSVNLSYLNLTATATASHIHGPASLLSSGGVLIDTAPYNGGAYGISGTLTGTIPLNFTQLGYIIDGLTYENFHTPSNPGGELRGQIVR